MYLLADKAGFCTDHSARARRYCASRRKSATRRGVPSASQVPSVSGVPGVSRSPRDTGSEGRGGGVKLLPGGVGVEGCKREASRFEGRQVKLLPIGF